MGIENSTLATAISIYHNIEQEDLSLDEFNMLKAERQRFMPLLGRFSLARSTELLVTKRPKSVTGDMAVTRLFCRTTDGQTYEYDDHRQEFMAALGDKRASSFKVEIAFCPFRIKENDEVGKMHSVGTLLQAFTHEMSVHAENMLDFIEDYWAYFDGAQQMAPPDLPTSSQEHAMFKDGAVKRYEYMSGRAATLPDGRGADYTNRQVNDMWTAK